MTRQDAIDAIYATLAEKFTVLRAAAYLRALDCTNDEIEHAMVKRGDL